MKKYILSAALLASTFGFAQHDHEQGGWCGFDQHLQEMYEKYPGSEEVVYETIIRNRESGATFNNGERTTIGIVPVVVHVIHDGGNSNISYDQIVSAIDQINEDWQRLNPDTSQTRNTANAPFLPVASDMQLEFKLARIDPNGDCTNGVERRYSPGSTINADDDVKHWNSGGMDAWPRNNYFNIWVVESIDAGGQGVILGYAQFPYFGSASEYGVVIRHDAFGTMGTASGDRTFSHEAGHCFGLFHTFEGGCGNNCGGSGDYCCDTPPVEAAQWSCGTSQNTCTNVPGSDFYGFDAYDQFENFMSYSPCQNMFSEDQKDIVHDNFANIGFLSTLISNSNATNTGVNQPDQLCKAEFTSGNTVICAGQSIDFEDISYFGVTGRTWTFGGGTPSTSSSANPTVTYNTPGIYDVTLDVTDGSNNESTTETGYVVVLADPGAAVPYHEGFEPYTSFPDNTNWFVQDDAGNDSWEQNNTYGSSGLKSAWIDNFGVSDESSDHLISGPLDMTNIQSGDNYVMTFKYAYRKRNSSNDEWLWVKVSDDCGESWTTKTVMHGDGLSDQTLSSPYYPDAADWVEVSVPGITSQYWISNFRFKFRFDNDSGNNIFIDDINIYPASVTEIQELTADNLSVYPNPVSEQMNISMDIFEAGLYTITLTNMLGQQVDVVYQGDLSAGEQKLTYDMEGLPQGAYFLNIESNGVVITEKVMKQ